LFCPDASGLASFDESIVMSVSRSIDGSGVSGGALTTSCVVEAVPPPVEVAAYYTVSEALANTAKHANASHANVSLEERDGALQLAVRDDGAGGADLGRGSGLVGLRDRVEALGGTIEVTSPQGSGTTVQVTLPTGTR
jgi:signal transduction histidine kinase